MENFNLSEAQQGGILWLLFTTSIVVLAVLYTDFILLPKWKCKCKKKNMATAKNKDILLSTEELIKLTPEELEEAYQNEIGILTNWIVSTENQWQLDEIAYDIVAFCRKFKLVKSQDEVQNDVNHLASIWQEKEESFGQPAGFSVN